MPLHLDVAARRRLGRRAVFGLEALVRRPRLQQRAVDGEVVAARCSGAAWPGATTAAKNSSATSCSSRRLRFLVNVGRVERRLVDAHVQEPLEQQVVVEPFAERPLRADRVHRHQHRRLQQRLRRHAAPATGRVHRVEHRRRARRAPRRPRPGSGGSDDPPGSDPRCSTTSTSPTADPVLPRMPHSLFDPTAKREHPQPNFSTLLGAKSDNSRSLRPCPSGLPRRAAAVGNARVTSGVHRDDSNHEPGVDHDESPRQWRSASTLSPTRNGELDRGLRRHAPARHQGARDHRSGRDRRYVLPRCTPSWSPSASPT